MSDFIKSLPADKPIHFIGIGGIGMSGLATCLIELGYSITGSDLESSEAIERLIKRGAKIYIGHSPAHLPESCNLIIKSAAIRDDNPELIKARQLGLPIMKYAQVLGELTKNKYGIAISGSHGKTTITAMISYILTSAQQDPSFLIGGYVPELKCSAKIGKDQYFVVEACEYDRSFYNLNYQIGIINNIEPDHLDYYRDFSALIDAFGIFASKIPPDGYLITNSDDTNIANCVKSSQAKVINFSLNQNHPQADWKIGSLSLQNGQWVFAVIKDNNRYDQFTLRIPGRHNVQNALVAIILSHVLGIDRGITKKALADFQGIARRFETIGKIDDITIIDDYAHHPTEIQATIRTVQETFPDRSIWYVFQPHQYSRTRLFLNDFVRVWSHEERVIITDIYSARDVEEEKQKISASDLVDRINQKGGQARYLPSFDEIISYLRSKVSNNDVIITIGAGDIWKVAKGLMKGAGK